jgi:hypothetical protein
MRMTSQEQRAAARRIMANSRTAPPERRAKYLSAARAFIILARMQERFPHLRPRLPECVDAPQIQPDA